MFSTRIRVFLGETNFLERRNAPLIGFAWVFIEAVTGERSIKKVFFANFAKFSGKHLLQSLFFNKVTGLWHRRIFPSAFILLNAAWSSENNTVYFQSINLRMFLKLDVLKIPLIYETSSTTSGFYLSWCYVSALSTLTKKYPITSVIISVLQSFSEEWSLKTSLDYYFCCLQNVSFRNKVI